MKLHLSPTNEDNKDIRRLIFRCLNTAYPTKRGYAQKTEMRFLSRLSNDCDYGLLDELKEFGAIMPGQPRHNGLYYLTITNHHYDWETGGLDDYSLIFKDVVE
jgi:hypothetical protein